MRVCKWCVALYGIKGSELAEKNLDNDEDFYNHLEEAHGIPVRRNGETEIDAKNRCAEKGIVEDRSLCECQECEELRVRAK